MNTELKVYLFGPDAHSFDDLLRPRGPREPPLEQAPPAPGLAFPHQLWRLFTVSPEPGWAAYLGERFDLSWEPAYSHSAVLLAQIDGRFLAVTFNRGSSALRRELLVNDFGRRVAANWTPADGLRRVHSRTYGHRIRTSTTALNQAGQMFDFGVDTNREMVHSLGGLSESKFAVRTRGDIALRVGPESEYASIDRLEELLRGALEAYAGTEYRAKFPFLDDYTELHPDSGLARGLTRDLMVRIRAGESASADVDTAPPDELWEYTDRGTTRFRIRGDRETRLLDEVTLADVRRHVHQAGDDALTRLEVRLVDAELHEHHPRPLLSYLTAETRRDARHFVLANGRWYEIGHRLLEYLAAQLATIPDARLELPRWRAKDDEGAYNASAAAQRGWALLDKKDFRFPGARGTVEICDLLTPDLELICVKKMNKSEKLSHLFAQGRVSATLYASDPDYAEAVHRYHDDLRGRAQRRRPKPSIVYAMGTPRPGDLRELLPFFSRRNLVTEAQNVRDAGFEVALAKIPMDRR
ncbi:DUF6119 family protein [Amycolatopsis anabasis]|uniref:DUF6119 family protein n=1 Tax=Amycolatopsis anabasis TaxID=1840409 RepID=UPI00131E55F7|nr:DUF6119 family protein [Amycolatopsis anabasis]